MNDREKLVELLSVKTCPNAICNFCEHFKKGGACKKHKKEVLADHLLANGVTFGKDTNVHTKWIPVTERLPIDEKPVLVYYGFMRKGNAVTGLRYTGTLSYFCFDHKPHWQHESTGLIVTHWMPLPEPPKED